MIDDVFVAHPTAKYGIGYVTKGFPRPKAVKPWVWRLVSPVFNPVAAFLTSGGMPPRAREVLGLPWSERKERDYQPSPRCGVRVRSTGCGIVCRWTSATTAMPQRVSRGRALQVIFPPGFATKHFLPSLL